MQKKKDESEQLPKFVIKYNKLKKRYRQLQQEYSKVLESWEQSAKNIKALTEERKFFKRKLDAFFKS